MSLTYYGNLKLISNLFNRRGQPAANKLFIYVLCKTLLTETHFSSLQTEVARIPTEKKLYLVSRHWAGQGAQLQLTGTGQAKTGLRSCLEHVGGNVSRLSASVPVPSTRVDTRK